MFNLHKLPSTKHKERALSLARCIVSIVTNNRENWLKNLKEYLLDRKHPQHIICYNFTKIFQPKFQTENNDNVTFIRTYNRDHNINLKKFHSCLVKIKSKELKTCFQNKNVLLSTIQPTGWRKILTTAKFERLQIPKFLRSNLKTNCRLCTINVLLVVTVKMFCIYNNWFFLYWTNWKIKTTQAKI